MILLFMRSTNHKLLRTEREYFNENAEFIKSLEFDKQELEIHRPDLPLLLNCFSDIFWTFNKNRQECRVY